MRQRMVVGDCRAVMAGMEPASVDAIVTDPPYGLEFMGKEWDEFDGRENGTARPYNEWGDFGTREHARTADQAGRVQRKKAVGYQAFSDSWLAEAFRVLVPGGVLMAFGGTRTWHRLAVAIEDAGFVIFDTLMWLHGSGFPKSHNIDRLPTVCQCNEVEYGHGATPTQHVMPDMPSSDVPPSVPVDGGQGALLQPRLPEQGAPDEEPADSATVAGRGAESVLEGRRYAIQEEGQLHGSSARPVSGGLAADGAGGRLRDGAPAENGAAMRLPIAADGGRAPSEPQAGRQRRRQSRTMAVQSEPQGVRARSDCPRCGLPVVPKGLGTALKPAWEPVIVARKPLDGTFLDNYLKYGTGPLNITAGRLHASDAEGGEYRVKRLNPGASVNATGEWKQGREYVGYQQPGRWPPNVAMSHLDSCREVGVRRVKGTNTPGRNGTNGYTNTVYAPIGGKDSINHYADPDGRESVVAWECAEGCPVAMLDAMSGDIKDRNSRNGVRASDIGYHGGGQGSTHPGYSGAVGGASRFFYTSKAGRRERWGILSCGCRNGIINAWESEDQSQKDRMDTASIRRATFASTDRKEGARSSTFGSGSGTTGPSPPATKSTTKTATDRTPTSAILSCSPPPTTSACTPAASGATADGGSGAGFVASSSPSTPSISTYPSADTRSTAVVGPVTLLRSLPISVCEKCGEPRKIVSHPTQKPEALIRWLVRMACPPGGRILDPFAGSGTTGVACAIEGFDFVGIEQDAEYATIARSRIAHHAGPIFAALAAD
jgi:DNA modification methylase